MLLPPNFEFQIRRGRTAHFKDRRSLYMALPVHC